MQINPYLGFNGQCEAAFGAYEQVLGGRITAKVTYAESPMADQVPSEWQGKINHASINVGGMMLMGGDPIPGSYAAPKGFSLYVTVDDPAEAERIFSALADKGTVSMPLQQTFWSACFGALVDRFGTPWMISCSK